MLCMTPMMPQLIEQERGVIIIPTTILAEIDYLLHYDAGSNAWE